MEKNNLDYAVKNHMGFAEAKACMHLLVGTGDPVSADARALRASEHKKISRSIRLPLSAGVNSWDNPIVGRVSFVGSSAQASFFLSGYVTKEQSLRTVEWEIEFPQTIQKLHEFRLEVSASARDMMLEIYGKVSVLLESIKDLEGLIRNMKKSDARNSMISKYKILANRFCETTGVRYKSVKFRKTIEKESSILPESMDSEFIAIS